MTTNSGLMQEREEKGLLAPFLPPVGVFQSIFTKETLKPYGLLCKLELIEKYRCIDVQKGNKPTKGSEKP